MLFSHDADEDDIFKDTRMSFGDHIEVLRTHLWRAIGGLLICMVGGFILDGIGLALDRPQIGIGRPVMAIIRAPVSKALVEFYDNRLKRVKEQSQQSGTESERANQPRPVSIILARDELAKLPGVQADQAPNGVTLTGYLRPLDIYDVVKPVQDLVRPPELTTLSAQEAFFVYFKVSLISGLVIASPWVFWQIWSFIAAGLYPHEKRYVHVYLPFSLGLFVAGVILCQFFVMPRAVAALLWFNDFLGMTPDLRLNEWLGLAILLPLVFGLSFQTPLIMLFLERLGVMGPDDFKAKRKYAWFAMAIFAALITPTPDALTMMYMWVPMCLLYELGIVLCVFSPGRRKDATDDFDVPQSDELIEV